MSTLVAVVAVLALVVAVLSLLVSLGTAARTRRAGGTGGAGGGASSVALADLLPAVGATVPTLPAGVAGSGGPPRRYGAAFVSTACEACRDSLPVIGGRSGEVFRVAVVLDDSRDPADVETYRSALGGHEVVVVEDLERPLSKAYGVSSYPAFVGVEDDRIVLSSHRADDLVAWERA